MNEWITLEMIGNFATALVALRFVVEYTKEGADALVGKIGALIGREWHMPTKLYSYAVALLFILIPFQLLTGTFTTQNAYLNLLNAFVLSIAAGFMQKPKQDDTLALPLEMFMQQQDEPEKRKIGFDTDK